MDVPDSLRSARRRAGLSQSELAARSETSQTAISAYERGRKEPSLSTLSRLLAATGAELSIRPNAGVREPTPAQFAQASRTLLRVLSLAEQLPSRPGRALRFPRLTSR